MFLASCREETPRGGRGNGHDWPRRSHGESHRADAQARQHNVRGDGQYSVPCEKLHQRPCAL